jgi:hypothetical protein
MRSIPPGVVVPSSTPSGAAPASGPAASAPIAEPDSLEQLIGDCRQMAQRWRTPAVRTGAAAPPASLHGITVPPSSVHVLDGMSEYGD